MPRKIEYYKLEQHDMLQPNKTRSVYRLKNINRISGEQFINHIARHHAYSESMITAVLMEVADELAELLGEGHSVELPGIGVFSIGVRMKDATGKAQGGRNPERETTGEETKMPTARNLYLHHLNFRKSPELFRRVNMQFHKQDFQRAYGKNGVRIKRSKYPQVKNRMIVAREFLATHPYMTIKDYAELTGLSYSTAQRELRANWNNPNYGIDIAGRGSHRVYVLRGGGSSQ